MAQRLHWRAPATGLAALVLFLLLGWDTFAGAASTAHERGRAIYNFRCYFCHGYSGDAQTLAASMLSPPPRDFTAGGLDAAAIERALRDGVPGTAMKSFANVLDEAERRELAAFVAQEFVRDRAPNTRYHTADNGWPDHERHRVAFPFARGELALDTPDAQLNDTQRAGRTLYLQACVSCHDRGRVTEEGAVWETRPLSYPRLGFQPGEPNLPPVDAVSSASVYAKHEVAPRLAGLTAQQRRGERLFRDNCAFCHGGDGSGRNWIGQFMEPHARDLTQYDDAAMPEALLKQRIREGLPGTSMPAWAAVLPPRDVDAVAAYVRRAFFRDAAREARAAR